MRFADSARLEAWRKSETWHRLLEDAAPLLAEKSSIEVEVKEAEGGSGVVEVIITQVKPGKEAAYREWETRIQQAQSKFPGYRGSYVQPPVSGELGWTTLMRFDTAKQLDTWLKSPERAALVKEAESLVDYAHLQRMGTSFPGWFPTDPKTGKGPPNWKAAMLVLLGLFPIVMLESSISQPRFDRESFTGHVHWQCHQCRVDHLVDDAVIHQNAAAGGCFRSRMRRKACIGKAHS